MEDNGRGDKTIVSLPALERGLKHLRHVVKDD
jgi:hypothetical protein